MRRQPCWISFPPDLDEAPPDARNRLALLVDRHRQETLGEEQGVGHDPDGDMHRIGCEIATGQPVHLEAAFELPDAVLDVGSLVIAPHDLFSPLLEHIGGGAVVVVRGGEQIALRLSPLPE